MPRKKKTLPKLKQEAAKLLQKIVRLKAAVAANRDGEVQCVTCGRWYHYKAVDAGHWIERNRTATLLTEENIHVQCKYCNQHGMKFRTDVREAYRQYMWDMYGQDFCDQLLIDSKYPKKLYRADLEEQIVEFKGLIKELESQL